MAINKVMRSALKALSYSEKSVNENYEALRKLKSLRAFADTTPVYRKWDRTVRCDGMEVPVRVYAPDSGPLGKPVMLFFHGGGWVTGDIESYSPVCAALSRETGHVVMSVDYRLAPEYRFPCALEDCYAVAKELFQNPDMLCVKADNITLIGDSAGGNLAAAVSLMAAERGEFSPRRQVLIYPATYWDHSESSPFESIRENGNDYLLTSRRVEEYIRLYIGSEKDLKSPYLAPLLAKNLQNQPDTLIITAEYDPLRDEGEEYGKRLAAAGNRVKIYRMSDGLHGFFSLPVQFTHVKTSMELIKDFIFGGDGNE